MEYATGALSRLSGVSSRTLRYYDEIGLLKPCRVTSSGERIYGAKEVDTLQQILFFRALSMPLKEIADVLAGGYDRRAALAAHLGELEAEQARLSALIGNVRRTLESIQGGRTMTDKEKFEGFKREKIEENEKRYGKEARQRYGDEAVDAANEKFMAMDENAYNAREALEAKVNEALAKAVATGNPAGAEAQEACALHKQWICAQWKTYSKQAHLGLANGYVCDPRFHAYYEKVAPGAAEFLRDALTIYLA